MGKQARRASRYRTIRGVISPAEWDDDDHVMAVVITDDDDDEFLVDPVGRGEDLLEMVDEYVEVKGVVHNDDGEYCVVVRSYRVIDGEDEEEDEDEHEEHEEEHDDDDDDDAL